MLLSLAGKQLFKEKNGALSQQPLTANDMAFIQDAQTQLIKLRAQLGSCFGIVADGGGVHLAYTQLLSINVACLLLLTPWGLYSSMEWFSLLATPMMFMHFFGLLVLARMLQLPFANTHNGMRIQHRQLLQEHESYWDRYPLDGEETPSIDIQVKPEEAVAVSMDVAVTEDAP